MEREPVEASEAPLELLNTAEACHKGLRSVELQQVHGRNGYTTIPGCRWRFKTDEGEPPSSSERPNISARDVAVELFRAAREVRQKPGNGGDQRFLAKFFCVDDDKGNVRPTSAKFEVPLVELAASNTIDTAERAAAYSSVAMMHELLEHNRALHQVIERLPAVVASSVEKASEVFTAGMATVLAVIPKIIDMRFEAAEEHAQALVERERNAGASSAAWVESARELVGIARSPIGIAAAAKLTGMPIEQVAPLLEQFAAEKKSAPIGSLRAALAELSSSLSGPQRAVLLSKLGTALAPLKAAQDATTDDEARAACTKFFAGLRDEHWNALGETLTGEQGALVTKIMELTRTAEP